jgi:hypothetical protein
MTPAPRPCSGADFLASTAFGGLAFDARYARQMIGGGVVMVVLMILILPVAVMLGGAIWSALMGFLLSENAADDAEAA